jgi:hypothetical protein
MPRAEALLCVSRVSLDLIETVPRIGRRLHGHLAHALVALIERVALACSTHHVRTPRGEECMNVDTNAGESACRLLCVSECWRLPRMNS